QVAVARPDGVYIYNMGSFETPAKVFEIDGALEIRDPRFSTKGDLISITVLNARPNRNPPYTTRLQLWDLGKNELLRELSSYDWLIVDPIFSPDDQFMAGTDSSYIPGGACCGEARSNLLIWSVDGESSDLPCRYAEECYARYGIGDTEFSPDSQILFWNIFDFPGTEVQKAQYYWWAINLVPNDEDATPIPDGLREHSSHRTGPFAGEINAIQFSPDGSVLYAHNDKTDSGSLWDVATGDLKLSLLAGTRVAGFMPGNTIVLADDNQRSAILLQIDTGRQAQLVENLGERDYISPATPDGRLLVAWEDFESLRFYGVPIETKSTL
ncbi:MAG: WD40 repeat domain-containing protein, partial [Anaerolineae bacterium]|nr:WD40 repeat domain-containing protein [Anaerolineae bacterium]